MEQFTFHIIRTNIIAAVFIIFVQILAYHIKGKYSSMWKYFMWLAISVSLLIPVNPFNGISPLKLEITPPASYAKYDSSKEPGAVSQSAAVSNRTTVPKSDHAIASSQTSVPIQGNDHQSTFSHSHTITLVSSKISLYGFLQFFFIIWIAGIVILAVYKTLLYRFSLRHLLRWSMPVKDKNILELYRYCCLKKHIVHPPKLMIGSKLSSPVLAGLLKTALYLPSEQYSMEELQFVFYHELSHYKCHDLWYRMLLLTVTTIYWFNPLLYLMEKEAEKDIENLCDSSVIRFCEKPERLAYNRLLLKTASFQHHIPYLATSLNDSTLVFKERILYMVNAASLNRKLTPALLLTFALTLVYAGIGCTIGNTPILPKIHSSKNILAISKNSDATDFSTTAKTSIAELSRVPLYTDSAQKQIQTEMINGTAVTLPAETPVQQTEAAQPFVTALSQTIYSTGTVNIRSGAGTEFAVIGTAGKDMPLAQTGICDNGWVQINWNGVTCYLSQDYVTETPPAIPPEEVSADTPTDTIISEIPPASTDISSPATPSKLINSGYFVDDGLHGYDGVEHDYGIAIVNVTDSSFHFGINGFSNDTGLVFPVGITGTAYFSEDGTSAVAPVEETTHNQPLYFQFYEGSNGTEISVSGTYQLDGKLLTTNSPWHQKHG